MVLGCETHGGAPTSTHDLSPQARSGVASTGGESLGPTGKCGHRAGFLSLVDLHVSTHPWGAAWGLLSPRGATGSLYSPWFLPGLFTCC